MSFSLPKKYYLFVHDAIRKVLGTGAEISAFVSSKGEFQCDMLVNSPVTDPDLSSHSCVTSDDGGGIAYVRDFAVGLQRYLGSSGVVVRRRRVDVVFADREVLQLALGAPRRAINNLQSAAEINDEPDWTRRNRLRISLGYDEDLFREACDIKINIAARMMEKWVFDTYFDPNGAVTVEEFLQKQAPPVTYWQAHGFSLSHAYRVDHHVSMVGTVAQNFAKYYGEFPFDNPYCPGEDLNTIASVEWLCRAWKQMPLEGESGEFSLLQLGSEPPQPPPPSSSASSL